MRGHYGFSRRLGAGVALLFLGRGSGLPEGCGLIKDPGHQQVLGGNGYYLDHNTKDNRPNGIMGYGGALTLVNGSPFDWTLSGQSSYQMDRWEFPTVTAGTKASNNDGTIVISAYNISRQSSQSLHRIRDRLARKGRCRRCVL